MMSQTEKILYYFERFFNVTALFQTVDGELFTSNADATAWAASLLSDTIVTINRPTSLSQEILPHAGKWVFMPDGASSLSSENLIANGYGELGDLTNFSKFGLTPFNDSQHNHLQGFTYDGNLIRTNDTLIPIDANNFYELQLIIKVLAGQIDIQNTVEIGLQFFDQDGLPIEYANFIEPTTSAYSEIKRAVNDGDYDIQLADTPEYEQGQSPFYSGDDVNHRCVAIFNHRFSNGKVSDTYTRTIIKDAYKAASDMSNNPYGAARKGFLAEGGSLTLYLKNPYRGPTIPAGTAIKNVVDQGILRMPMYGKSFNAIGQEGDDPLVARWYYGYGIGGSSVKNVVNFTHHAKFAKLYIKASTAVYTKLELAGISLKVVPRGSDISLTNPPSAYPFHGCYIPVGMQYLNIFESPPKLLVAEAQTSSHGTGWLAVSAQRRLGNGTTI